MIHSSPNTREQLLLAKKGAALWSPLFCFLAYIISITEPNNDKPKNHWKVRISRRVKQPYKPLDQQ